MKKILLLVTTALLLLACEKDNKPTPPPIEYCTLTVVVDFVDIHNAKWDYENDKWYYPSLKTNFEAQGVDVYYSELMVKTNWKRNTSENPSVFKFTEIDKKKSLRIKTEATYFDKNNKRITVADYLDPSQQQEFRIKNDTTVHIAVRVSLKPS